MQTQLENNNVFSFNIWTYFVVSKIYFRSYRAKGTVTIGSLLKHVTFAAHKAVTLKIKLNLKTSHHITFLLVFIRYLLSVSNKTSNAVSSFAIEIQKNYCVATLLFISFPSFLFPHFQKYLGTKGRLKSCHHITQNIFLCVNVQDKKKTKT